MKTYCPKCGAEVAGDFKFCSSCGSEVRTGVSGRGKISGDLEGRILDLLRKNEYIPAVRLVRENTGMGLKESADYVKGLAAKNGIVVESSPGSLVVLAIVSVIMLASLGLAVYFIAMG